MPETVKLATYLFKRLQQLGIDSLHGVPGDFNLTLLDYVEPAGLRWVGSVNELNAAYASDGYSRMKRIAALVTTFGVGELSAINAIAGSYSERAAVVHIVGIPSRPMQDSRMLIHHTMKDGDFSRFSKAYSLFTVAQERLWDPRTSADQIDHALKECLRHSRPVYIEVPVDMVSAPLSAAQLATPLEIIDTYPTRAQDKLVARILERIYSAKQPVIFIDGEARSIGIVEEVQHIAKLLGWPTWSTGFSKGLLDETAPNFHGVYKGTYDEPENQKFFNEADLVLCFGPHFSTTNSYGGGRALPKPEATISISFTDVQFGNEQIRDIPGKSITAQLVQSLDASKVQQRYETYPQLARDANMPIAEVLGDGPVTHDRLWRVLGNFLRPGDILMGETGTSSYGVREVAFPQHTRLFTHVTWLSIGYMLPAAQGAALALEELMAAGKYNGITNARTVLFIGDGSIQMTIQELATMVRHNLNVVVVVVNNNGYTVERCIHGMDETYNDISPWRYLKAPALFGAKEDSYTATVNNWNELEKVFNSEEIVNGTGLRMVELFMDRDDAPKGPLFDYMAAQKAGNGILREPEEEEA